MLRSRASNKERDCSNCESGLNLSIRLTRLVLRPLGLWPSSNRIFWPERLLWSLVHLVCHSLIAFLLVPCFACAILEVKDIHNGIKLTGPISFCLMTTLKYHSLIHHGDDIRECVEYIKVDWSNTSRLEDRKVMVANANFGRRLIVICALFMFGGAFFVCIAAPASMFLVGRPNLTFIPLGFPFPNSIIDTRRSPTNEIFFMVQCLSGFTAHAITVACCSLAAAFAMHAYGQLEILMIWLDHLVDGREDFGTDVNGRLVKVVEQHLRVLRFVSLMEKTLQQISLVEILGCTLGICLLGYYVIMEWNPNNPTRCFTYFILLISLTFNIFIFCYVGELVDEQCKRIGDATYLTDWYQLPRKRRLDLILMIVMASSSKKLTAGNIASLSLASFGNVIKASFSYLNMLRTLTS